MNKKQETARKVAALTGARFLTPLAIRGSDHLVAAVSREIDAGHKGGTLALSGDGWSLRVFYGSPVSTTEAQAVEGYCSRHSLESPAYLSLYSPTGDTSKADQPATGWQDARVSSKGKGIAPARLEYVADGCRVERDGAVFRVKVGGLEVARIGAFRVSTQRLDRWMDTAGSPFRDCLKITAAEKANQEKGRAKSALETMIAKYRETLSIDEIAECLGLPPEAIAAAAK